MNPLCLLRRLVLRQQMIDCQAANHSCQLFLQSDSFECGGLVVFRQLFQTRFLFARLRNISSDQISGFGRRRQRLDIVAQALLVLRRKAAGWTGKNRSASDILSA